MRSGYVGWVSLDVNSSVSDWLQSTERRQDGLGHHLSLRVVVSDARSRAPVDAFTVFQPPNCARHQPPHTGTVRFLQWRSWDFCSLEWGSRGLSIVPVVPWEGAPVERGPPPISCQIFTTLFLRLNVQCTTFLGKKCTATGKKIMASRTRKGPRLTLVCPLQMVNPALGEQWGSTWF